MSNRLLPPPRTTLLGEPSVVPSPASSGISSEPADLELDEFKPTHQLGEAGTKRRRQPRTACRSGAKARTTESACRPRVPGYSRTLKPKRQAAWHSRIPQRSRSRRSTSGNAGTEESLEGRQDVTTPSC